jgi:ABC-2 type transport system permease protein
MSLFKQFQSRQMARKANNFIKGLKGKSEKEAEKAYFDNKEFENNEIVLSYLFFNYPSLIRIMPVEFQKSRINSNLKMFRQGSEEAKKELVSSWISSNKFFMNAGNIGLNDEAIIGSIKDGTVAYELLRPYDLYTWWYVKLVARRYALVMLRCLPIIVFALILPVPYNLSLPVSIGSFLMFLLTMFLGTIIVTAINMIVNSLAFFTNENRGISSIIYTIADLLEGSQIPLPLLSGFVLVIASFTPFRYIEDLPFRLYSGHIDIMTGIKEISIELIWIIGLLIIGKLILKKALSKVSIQGG